MRRRRAWRRRCGAPKPPAPSAEARRTIDLALKQLDSTNLDAAGKMRVAIQDARVQAAEIRTRTQTAPNLSAPRRKLQEVVATARKLNYYEFECEARLALGEIEIRENPATARAHLSELASEAREHGMNLILRKATELGSSNLTSEAKRSS